MPTNTARVSLYLSNQERSALRQAAQRLGQAENYVVRLLLRQAFGLPLTELNQAEIEHMIPARDPHTTTHI